MKKFERLVEKAINEAGATVLERLKASGHIRLMVRTASGQIHKLTVSSSPRIPEHALTAVARDVKRLP